MFQNDLKTTFRGIVKNKTYSFLNIAGLAIGIACAALIFLWIEDELHYDDNNVKKDRLSIIRVNNDVDGGVFTHSSTPGPMATSIRADIPGIANTCRMTEGSTSLLFTIGNKSVYASGNYAEPSAFDMFTLTFAQGDPKNAFSQLYSIVITEKTARKFFGDDKDVLGRTVQVDHQQEYVVTGVIKDLPENASLQFEWVAPFQIYFNRQLEHLQNWSNFGLNTFVELEPGVDPESINRQLRDYIQKKQGATASVSHAFLFSMNDWRLYDDFDNGKKTGGGRIEYVRLFSVIAWIILFVACINFMNLATARSEKKAKEIGVKKVLGAERKRLVTQMLTDSLILSTIAAIAAIIILLVVLPLFNTLVNKNLHLGLDNPVHLGALLLLTIVSGLIAGSYPSLYLSSFNPVNVLKGLKVKEGSAIWIRKGLVVLQFTVSIVLIIATIIVYQQIQHVKSRNLGYNTNNLIQMGVQGDMAKNFAVIKQDLLNTQFIEDAALADHETISGGNNTTDIHWDGKDPNSIIVISQRLVSKEFMHTIGMHLREGRDFVPTDEVTLGANGRPKDSSQVFNVVVTASMAKLLGGKTAIGKTVDRGTDNGALRLQVVGVIDDYVYGNMYGTSSPVIFYCVPQAGNLMYIRSRPHNDPQQVLAAIQTVMKRNNPAYPFEYAFVDDQFNQRFVNEMLISKLSRVFASLAIIISCLGLFGLASFTAERRRKEVGIRKVLGAGVAGLSALLSKDFLKLVVLSCLIAFPLAWWGMHQWLQQYEYRIKINAWIFVIAGLISIVIAFLTVSYQAISAASANPVKSLRTD